MTFGVLPSAASFASNFDVIGPYVGFVSIIGVVAMGILVFAQGRELQRLREWVGTAPERLAELEQRVASGAASPPPRNVQAGPPRPAVPPGRPVGSPPGAPPRPVAPATTASAAAATAAAASAAAVRASGTGPAQLGAGTGPATAVNGPPRPTPPGAQGPAGATGDGGASRPTPPTPPAPATAAALAASTQRERQAHAEAAMGSSGGGPSIPQAFGVATVLCVVIAALLFALGIIGGGEGNPVAADNRQAEVEVEKERKAPPYSAASTRVAVLNGSGESGLAKGASTSLENARFTTEFADYTENGVRAPQSQTTVAYRSGGGNKAAATDIAKLLKIQASAVKPMSSTIRSAAQGNPQIVVVLGSDYATRQGVAPADQSGVPPEQQSTSGTGATGSATTDPGTTPDAGIAAPNP
ncbi:MAG: LytR C-terminal domain-containing protein [Solirubrobacteraceae bacterium]|nr:LytR C-terminal domain-containing protein [Solirubrobacteraceae bacterium]